MAQRTEPFLTEAHALHTVGHDTQQFQTVLHAVAAFLTKSEVVFTTAAFFGVTVQNNRCARMRRQVVSVRLDHGLGFGRNRVASESKVDALLAER